jgi:hypothetical protein
VVESGRIESKNHQFGAFFNSFNSNHTMATINLETLASETNASLMQCWDDLGVSSDERASYLQTLAIDVEAIYRSRVEAQEQRRAAMIDQISSLESVIQNMQRAMEEPDTTVCYLAVCRNPSFSLTAPSPVPQRTSQIPRGSMTLIDFFASLEAKRSALQEVSAAAGSSTS